MAQVFGKKEEERPKERTVPVLIATHDPVSAMRDNLRYANSEQFAVTAIRAQRAAEIGQNVQNIVDLNGGQQRVAVNALALRFSNLIENLKG